MIAMARRAVFSWWICFSALAWAGSYGSYKEPRAGYTIAKDVSVGSMSDHSREADAMKAKEAAAKQMIAPLCAPLDAWVARARGVAAYRGWLKAWDPSRRTSSLPDYKWRLPAPFAKQPPAEDSPTGSYDPSPLILCLHMQPSTTQLARGRALVGFALAEAELGDGALRLPTEPGLDTVDKIATLLDQLDHSDGYAGQPSLVATGILFLAHQQAVLAKIAADAKQAATVRLLARAMLHGYRRDAWTEADWALAAAAVKGDPRQTWTWILLFADDKDLAATRAELARRFPLSDEHQRYFVGEWLDSTRD
jgi:hypothetical protein